MFIETWNVQFNHCSTQFNTVQPLFSLPNQLNQFYLIELNMFVSIV